MPEGDTLYVVAERVRPVLVGEPLVAARVRLGRGDRFGPPRGPLREVPRLAGIVVDAVYPRGKNLLVEMGPFALRVHLGMSGSFHRYDRGARYRLPARFIGVALHTAEQDIVCFKPPTVALGRINDIKRSILHLGPDLLVDPVPWDAVVANAMARPDVSIADALLDQRIAAGIGNVYKNEVLFLQKLHPDRPMGTLTADQVRQTWELASTLMRRNVGGAMRSTTGQSGSQRTYVYGRQRQDCPTCGARLSFLRHGAQARATWFCPSCQR